MTDYKKYINALRKCAKEHESDRTLTGYIVVADLCRDTADLLEKLEREHILEKIKDEFIDRYPRNYANELELGGRSCVFSLNEILRIIDKYEE